MGKVKKMRKSTELSTFQIRVKNGLVFLGGGQRQWERGGGNERVMWGDDD
jgi:hypothetical protein